MTAEYACTRKQFNRNLSEFGLIQVGRVQSAAWADYLAGTEGELGGLYCRLLGGGSGRR